MKLVSSEAKKEIAMLALDDRLEHFGSLFSKNEQVQNIFRAARNYSDSLIPILIEGDIGTGKQSLAFEMHCHVHPRNTFHVFKVVCDSFDTFREVKEMTVFIEELEELDSSLQGELISYLKWQKESMKGARIIAATCVPINKLVDIKADLFFQLGRIRFFIPPLRERKEDILPLINCFTIELTKNGKNISHFSYQLLNKMIDYHWPLNMSELKNEIRFLATNMPHVEKWTEDMTSQKIVGATAKHMNFILKHNEKLSEALENLEKVMILESLRRTNWNKSKTSRELGISRSGLIQKVEKYGLMPFNS